MGGKRSAGRTGTLLVLLAVALVAVSCTTAPAPPPTRYTLDYTSRCDAPDPADCTGMLVFGDSLSSNPGRYNATRWQDLVADGLAGDPSRVVRRHFDGEIQGSGPVAQWDFARPGFSAGMWVDLPQYLPDAAQMGPLDLVVLALGINDEGQNVPPERYGEALDELLDRYPSRRCVVIGQWEWSIAYAQQTGGTFLYRAPQYNAVAAAVATERGCGFVDMTTLVSHGVAEAPASFDGVHLSEEGHAELAGLVLSALPTP